jgi:urea transporter
MKIATRWDGIAIEDNPPLEFGDSVLRGVAQVMFQNNTYTGILILAGIFVNSLVFGAAAILGTVVATVTAMLMSVDRSLVKAGLFGFNGTLTGIAVTFFLKPEPLAWLYLVGAAACCSVVMAALLNLLSKWETPALTAPFVFTTWFFLLASYRFSQLHGTPLLPTAGLPSPLAGQGIVGGLTFFEGFFKGVSEVFFQDNVITGAIFLLALVVNSRISFAAAVVASITGLLVGLGLGASEQTLRLGLFGFNSVLTAIALGGVFYVLDWKSGLYALFATAVTAVIFAAIATALTPLGIPGLTGPFVFTTWLYILAKTLFPRLRAVAPVDARSPEQNLAAARAGPRASTG